MCEPASFIVTKNRILWSKLSNSHETIIKENKLNDSSRDPDFVRIEISPRNRDLNIPMKDWKFKVDQDFKPIWFDPREVEISARLELPKWRKCFVINRKSSKPITVSKGKKYVLNGNIIVKDGFINFYGKSTGKVSGGIADFYNNSRGTVSGGDVSFNNKSTGKVSGGDVKFYDNSTGKVSDGIANFYGNSKGKVSEGNVGFWGNSNGEVSGGKAIFWDNSKGEVSGGIADFYNNSRGEVSGGDVKFFDKSKRLN